VLESSNAYQPRIRAQVPDAGVLCSDSVSFEATFDRIDTYRNRIHKYVVRRPANQLFIAFVWSEDGRNYAHARGKAPAARVAQVALPRTSL
jgi:hypothetical protein